MCLCIFMTFFTDDFYGMDYYKFFISGAAGAIIGVYLAYRVYLIHYFNIYI